ncbi:FKBP-type peptidyl-prolyl cis-trans isomerase [Streptacidiphilus sp. P02-A3a]|uniref:FKBP-type peptidyl-prolyl cis-trans isomerase n=1 Tax=Streptacidiphilus sp. P02-A3a TaxID=2704468 RepID=UPI0015FAB720|nr:FKBP-type peptidyl-prolyl cis-trans isomerase [Streptacidiphilus sp. P02-A3a]QMU69052.1 FKBP-type peptidyl-prolyl cis-trans isomerase [Streptacidiphilus sp. P02-A3a]
MRRTTAAAALLLVPTLLLTGCGSSTKASSSDATSVAPVACAATPSSTPTATSVVSGTVDSADPMPVVSGAYGKSATITTSGKPTDKLVVNTLTQGTGAVVGSGDTAVANVVVKDWTTGKTVSDSYASKAPLVAGLSGMIPGLKAGIQGRTIGSRVLVVAPPADAATQLAANEAQQAQQGGTSMGVGAKDTLALVIDITGAVPTNGTASGTAAKSIPASLPVVNACDKKAATITIPKGATAPTALQSAVLIKGNGPKVTSGQTIITQYTGVTWADGKVFDSSWNDNGAVSFPIGVGQVIKGWDQSLVGQTVGSRIEVVIPPSLGYGSTAQSSIPANSTLVFVVDILGAA